MSSGLEVISLCISSDFVMIPVSFLSDFSSDISIFSVILG